jgi:hypothetical protein
MRSKQAGTKQYLMTEIPMTETRCFGNFNFEFPPVNPPAESCRAGIWRTGVSDFALSASNFKEKQKNPLLLYL